MTAVPIVVIEDSEDDFLLLERRFKAEEFPAKLRRVETAQELMSALKDMRPKVVVSDLKVPGMSAEQSMDIVAELSPDVPVIFISGAASEEELVSVMRAGASDILLKSRLTRLVPVITRELQEYEGRRARRLAEDRLNVAVENIQRVW